MWNLFERKDLTYNLRSGSLLKLPTAKTTTYGTSLLASEAASSGTDTIKGSPCVNKFKLLMKEWKGENCNCKIVGRTTSVETPFDILFMLIFNFVQVVL